MIHSRKLCVYSLAASCGGCISRPIASQLFNEVVPVPRLLQLVLPSLRIKGSNSWMLPSWTYPTIDCALVRLYTVTVAERLRRWTRNPMGFPRTGSNPVRDVASFLMLQLKETVEGFGPWTQERVDDRGVPPVHPLNQSERSLFTAETITDHIRLHV